MSAPQWFAVAVAALVGLGCLVGLWHEWRIAAERVICNAYRGAGVAYDDAELADMVAADEAAWAEWESICGILGTDPADGTPIYDRLVCEELERVNGWAS